MKNIKKAFAVVFAVMAVMLMSTAVFAEVISSSCYDFDRDTGVLTLKNNIDRDTVRNFEYKKEVTEIKFGTGAALPDNCASFFAGFTNCEKITISKVDTSNVRTMNAMFSGCQSLKTLDLSSLNTSNVKDMQCMFNDCESLTLLDLSGFDTSKVQSMNYMFNYCKQLKTLDLTSFDTSNVTSMMEMFKDCSNLTSLNVSSFNTSNVHSIRSIFSGCKSLTSLNVNNFDTSNVTNMASMFNGCESLTSLDLSNFKTNKVTNMNRMFLSCKNLTSLDISSFDTLNVTDMESMFSWCNRLGTLDLSNFNTSSVNNMNSMFYLCSSLTSLDISSFDTSNVTNMGTMFYSCKSLKTLDLKNFDTSSAINMASIFFGCEKLEQLDVSRFDTSSVTQMSGMFRDCKALTTLDLKSFDTSKVTSCDYMFKDCGVTSLTLGSTFFKYINANLCLVYDENGWRKSTDLTKKAGGKGEFENKYYAMFIHSGRVTYLRVEVCNVTYDANDGSGTTKTVSAVKGYDITLPECDFTAPSGKAFCKWQIGSAQYNAGDTYNVTGDTTIKAVWNDGITVSFNAGTGSGTMPSVTIGRYSQFVLPENTFTAPAGYLFARWDKNGSVFHAGDKVTLDADTTFTAQWRNYYVVKFDANDGSGSMTNRNINVGGKLTLPECGFTAPSDDYLFAGWLIGNKKYQPNEQAEISGDTTVYALWAERDYWKVIFDAGEGSGSMSEIHIPHDGDHILTLPECTFTAPTASKSFYKWKINNFYYAPGETLTVTSDITVEARWLVCSAWYLSDNGSVTKNVDVNVKYGQEYTLLAYEDVLALNSSFTGPAGTVFDHWSIKGETYHPGDTITIAKQFTDIKAVYIYTGECGNNGDNCTWTFDTETGTLTIRGTGKMTAYGKDSRPPWYDLKNKIKKVVIEDGITYVGSWSFEGCTRLKEAVLADSVKTIAPFSFKDTALTGINIPKKVQIIGNAAFLNTAMTYVIIPESITSMGSETYSVGFNADTSTSPWAYTKADGFVICGYAGTAAETYANGNGFDFIQLGNVSADTNHVVDEADAALLLKYIDGTATLSKKQAVAARMTDSIKDDPDMLDVIAILNT